MRRATRSLTLAALAALPGLANADRSEEIFHGALAYTVEVRAAVPAPFEPDLKGTLRGAGFVVDAARGWILTNAHVAARSPSRVEVAVHAGRFVEARKLYVDAHLDLAVLELPPAARADLVTAPLECGASPGVGHPVGAFGHPWSLKFTGTRGIISGVTSRTASEALQTDAPINGGNSGGPLISLVTGSVVGINTAQIRGSQNTNFAVAMKYACRILSLMQEGRDPSVPDLKIVYYGDSDGARQVKVARNYAPRRLALEPGDVIRGVVDVVGEVSNETQLNDALRGRLEGFSLRVERNGREIVVPGSAAPAEAVAGLRGVVAGGVLFGLTALRDAAEIQVGRLMVHHVERGSEGDAKELQRGDFVQSVDGAPVESLEQLVQLLDAARAAGRAAMLTFKRYGGSDRAFVYLERELSIEDVVWIGNGVPTAAAADSTRRHAATSPSG